MNRPLISVITPCYNGAKFIHRLLDSLLEQTYPHMEIFFINDGSTDETEEIAKSYMSRFQDLGIKFIYIYQENAGQAAALNKALKLFSGDYLVWPDSDDFYNPDSLNKFLLYLLNNPQVKMVRCKTNCIAEDTGEVLGSFALDAPGEKLFDDCILENDFWFCPISFMVESKTFLEVLPDREIYVSRGGQNWQMYLPVLFNHSCGYISESNANYLVRAFSHSRDTQTLKERLQRRGMHKDILYNTFKKIDLKEEELTYYNQLVEDKYNRIFYREYLKSFLLRDAIRSMIRIKRKNRSDYIYPLRLLKHTFCNLFKSE